MAVYPLPDYDALIEPHRAALRAHCYRMLGSAADADDALQETMLRAWRGLDRFEGRSSLRSWLYRVATNVCLRMLERRSRRVLPIDLGPPADPHGPVGRGADAPWLEPYPTSAVDESYEERESVELAFIAALQHLPARQRAVLLLRDVLGFAPAEIAEAIDASPAAVYSALQRAHRTMEERRPERTQQATLRALGDDAVRELAQRYVSAWERADVDAIVAMLTEDATFAMPPRSEWFRGRDAIGAFLSRSPLSGRYGWRLTPAELNGQTAFSVFTADRRPHGTTVLDLTADGRIASVTSFHR